MIDKLTDDEAIEIFDTSYTKADATSTREARRKALMSVVAALRAERAKLEEALRNFDIDDAETVARRWPYLREVVRAALAKPAESGATEQNVNTLVGDGIGEIISEEEGAQRLRDFSRPARPEMTDGASHGTWKIDS